MTTPVLELNNTKKDLKAKTMNPSVTHSQALSQVSLKTLQDQCLRDRFRHTLFSTDHIFSAEKASPLLAEVNRT
ncbi:hypothetical protein [Yoonia sp. R78084]|uniref:hypothetical protein n=1 Tax=Yoonia sp. R78084 TaxID=3093869 RepID=UPI0037DC7CFD